MHTPHWETENWAECQGAHFSKRELTGVFQLKNLEMGGVLGAHSLTRKIGRSVVCSMHTPKKVN